MTNQFHFDIRLIFATLNGKVSAAIYRQLYRDFRKNGLDITPEQWTILIYLWEKDGVKQQDLCEATFKDKPSMTRLIDNMERQHLVLRVPSDTDGRVKRIYLTPTGRDLEERTHTITSQTLESALEGISNEEIEICQEVLKKIFQNTTEGSSI